MSECRIEGCARKAFSRGVCQPHYDRHRRYGDYNYKEPTRHQSPLCAVDGCGRKRKSTKYCYSHYWRVKRHGDLHACGILGQPKKGRKCSVEGCDRPHSGLGYCSRHYCLYKRWGDPSPRRKIMKYPPEAKCEWEGCTEAAKSDWLCQRHYDAKTADRRKERMRKHYLENKAYYKEKKQRRHHIEKRSTPIWLNDIQRAQMNKIYRECPKGHEVDHIIPLNGENVCGLHVPWNLQCLTAEENRAKGNKLCAA